MGRATMSGFKGSQTNRVMPPIYTSVLDQKMMRNSSGGHKDEPAPSVKKRLHGLDLRPRGLSVGTLNRGAREKEMSRITSENENILKRL